MVKNADHLLDQLPALLLGLVTTYQDFTLVPPACCTVFTCTEPIKESEQDKEQVKYL